MWRTFKNILGAGLALGVLAMIVLAVIVPVLESPDPGQALDAAGYGILNWLGSPGPNGGDPRIVLIAFLGGLVWIVLFAMRKLRESTKKAFGKTEKPKPKNEKEASLL